jgi:hypothetical protein
MFKFALKKQSAQTNLHSCKEAFDETLVNVDDTINISKFPLLYATPERTKVEQTTIRDMAFGRVKSVIEINKTNSKNAKSPIDTSFTSIKPIDIDMDQTYEMEANSIPLAYINQLSNSPLCSTAMVDSCNSINESINSQDETYSVTEVTEFDEQFHSVNGSFFDFNRREVDTHDLFYICFQSFQANDASQISLNYSDIVKLIYAKGNSFLVQHMATGKRGYVPKEVISNLTQPWVNSKSLNI